MTKWVATGRGEMQCSVCSKTFTLSFLRTEGIGRKGSIFSPIDPNGSPIYVTRIYIYIYAAVPQNTKKKKEKSTKCGAGMTV